MEVCGPYERNCDICFKLTLPLDDMNVEAGLTPASTPYLWIIDKFGKVFRVQITIEDDGSFNIDPDDFPEGMFNESAGSFDVFLSEDEDGNTIIPIIFDSVEYNCIIFNFTCP